MVDIETIKEQFPIFKEHPDLSYLDSGASTQTPDVVLDAVAEYYSNYRANIHRGQYKISEKATQEYEGARKNVADFLHSSPDEIVFTYGTTHGLNLLAYSLCQDLKVGDNVVITRMEHHANLIPWQQMAKKYGFELRFINLNQTYELDLESASRNIDVNTKIVSLVHISNTLGTINPVEKIVEMSKKVGAISIIDAAQSVAHLPIDVKKIDCDALVFSGHKIYGPTGIGVLYAKKNLLEKMDPFLFGGDMILDVTYENSVWNEVPYKFEAGTPNIAGAIGLSAALKYIQSIGWDYIQIHEKELTEYALAKLSTIPFVKIIGIDNNVGRAGVVSFTIEGIHFHDIASILDKHNVAVRAGHHCTMPLMRYLGINGTTRASFGVYNSKEDINKLVEGLEDVIKIFQKA